MLDCAACGLLRASQDGELSWVNRRFCEWLGYTRGELVGRRFQDLLSMGGRIFHQTHWAPLLHLQGSVSEVKLELVHRDGALVPMVLNAVQHVVDGRLVVEIAAYVARDRDKYERELVQARKRLEELVAEATRLQAQAKDRAALAEQMLGIVSHDLRNPLSSIAMGTALLERSGASDDQRRVLARIKRSTERANWLIADLLDFTQVRLGKGLSISPVPLDVHRTTADALDELALAHHGRRMLHQRSGEGPCVADPNRLAQLIGNLVANAVVYGDPQHPVTVTSVIEDASFWISVHNQGTPIPEHLLPSIFAPLERGTTPSDATRSIGLGLFIVSEIARAHGGSVSVQSAAAAGTTFRATFPRATAETASRASPAHVGAP